MPKLLTEEEEKEFISTEESPMIEESPIILPSKFSKDEYDKYVEQVLFYSLSQVP